MSDQFVAALIGAGVGGFAVMLGSFAISRWESTRTYRIRIYDELLPRLLKNAGNEQWRRHDVARMGTTDYRDGFMPVLRAGHVASRRDRRRVDRIELKLAEASEAFGRVPWIEDRAGGGSHDWDSPEADEYWPIVLDFFNALDEYREWLKARLS